MLNAVIFGTGNIAFHFYSAISNLEDLHVSGIFTRSEEKAKLIVGDDDIDFIYEYSSIPENTDVVFLMVNDDSIPKISKTLSKYLSSSTIIIHFSGSLGLFAIHEYFEHKGIIWPIQSISKTDLDLNLRETPLSLSFSDENTGDKLKQWASHISEHLYYLSDDQKKAVHLSAVFANNFTNHLYVLAKEILRHEYLDFDLIKPLILKTAHSALKSDPILNQTGPANRQDQKTMDKQIAMLSDSDQKAIYRLISKSIDKKNNE